MLDLRQRFYVGTDFNRLTCATLEKWATNNMMKLGGAAALSSGEQVYELDVQYNDNLRFGMRTISRDGPDLKNGERSIGSVRLERVLINHNLVSCYVIRPEIPDR